VLTCATDEEIPTQAGEVIYAPAGVPHGMRNTGDEDLRLLAIFSPPLT
jgi:mannose-6-phosphate isomerase-like protein (cupin superfamily)